MKVALLIVTCLTLLGCSEPSASTSEVENAASIETNLKTELSPYSLPDTHIETLASKLAGQNYRLYIRYPGGYFESTEQTTYPVVYLLDAQWTFPLLTSITGSLEYDQDIEQVIVVGITWEGDNKFAEVIRAREFTPTESRDMDVPTGGANQFISVLKEEIIPHVENTYKAGETRILMGSSFGGLFTLYTLYTTPELFDTYVASSPSLWWDSGVMTKFQKEFEQTTLLNEKKLYLSRGGKELHQHVVDKLAVELKDKAKDKLLTESGISEGAGHGTDPIGAYVKGLQFAFKKKEILVSEAILKTYVGTYDTGPDLPDAKFWLNKGVLYSTDIGSGVDYRLYAIEENIFLQPHAPVELTFKENDNNEIYLLEVSVRGKLYQFPKK